MIVYMNQYKDQKMALLKEVHEKVKEALDHEPIQVETVEEAAAWCPVSMHVFASTARRILAHSAHGFFS